MPNNYLEYRTFDDLMNNVRIDFRNYDLDGIIDDSQLIKVVKKINYLLGLRIQQTKGAVIEIEKRRGKLPNDFYSLNFAMICGQYEIKVPSIQGTHIEERPIGVPNYVQAPPEVINKCAEEPLIVDPCDPCNLCGTPKCSDECLTCASNNTCRVDCKGNYYEVIQVINYQIRRYKITRPLQIISDPAYVECDCPNIGYRYPDQAWLKGREYIETNFSHGHVYINYQGMLEDDDGNLLIPDHELINEYYEYAVKDRILENLIMNDEPVTQAKIQLIKNGLRESKNQAMSLVRTPNFSELKQIWEANRKAQYARFYDMFRSYGMDGAFLR